jgi:thymidylate synthase (FAD)
MKTINKNGIEYELPSVTLLNVAGLGISEFAGRTAYNSFDKSENSAIKDLDVLLTENEIKGVDLDVSIKKVNAVEHSNLLDSLAWVHHHHSVLEQCELWFSVKGTSRGVLQEHSRHRHQELTVQSTRYTMSSVINAFIASYTRYNSTSTITAKGMFNKLVIELNMFVIADKYMIEIESNSMYDKLLYQLRVLGEDKFIELATSKNMRENGSLDLETTIDIFDALEQSKQVRNIGDNFKHIVTDNWKVDMVFKMNLRSLKNYLTLRDSGSAYFLMKELAIAIKEATPKNYLDLIIKQK